MNILFLLLIGIPAIEIFIMIKVGQNIGAPNTIGLIFLTAIIGIYFAKITGLNTLRSAIYKLRKNKNQIPLFEIISGASIAFAALLLIIPGFITDVFGFLLLMPFTRNMLTNLYLKEKPNVDTGPKDYIDGEVIKKEEDKEHYTLTLRKSERSAYLNIPTTTIMSVPTPTEGSGDFGFKWTDASEGDVWSLPENTHNTLYPHGHVYETESGHIMEFDDTKEAARILLYHRSGSEMEITDKGTKNTLNKDSTYTITEKDKKVYIKGNSDLTIRGRHKIIINADGEADNNYDIQVGPNANVNIQCDKGDINLTSLDGNLNMFTNEDLNMWVGGTWNVKAGQIVETSQTTTTRKAAGLYHTFGGPIDHN